MRTLITSLSVLVLLGGCAWIPTKPVRNEPVASWETIFFRSMDDAARLSNMEPLREKRVRSGDIEVRIWRGFGLSDLEMVVLTRQGGIWEGKHIIGNDYIEITETKVEVLPPPTLGWDAFWSQLVQMGILDLQTPLEESCAGGFDGIGHVVEISKAGTYRTYRNTSFTACESNKQLDLISEFIGLQFDQENSKCETSEWFPCAKVIQKRRPMEQD